MVLRRVENEEVRHHTCGRVNRPEKYNMIIKQPLGSLEVHDPKCWPSAHSFAQSHKLGKKMDLAGIAGLPSEYT